LGLSANRIIATILLFSVSFYQMNEKLETQDLLNKLICFSNSFNYFSIHVSNNHPSNYNLIAAFGAKRFIRSLQELQLDDSEFKFGLITYDLKNQLENLQSIHMDKNDLDDIYFFIPEIIVEVKNGLINVSPRERENEFYLCDNYRPNKSKSKQTINIKCSTTKEEYLNSVNQLKSHIQKGDIYEINYCINHYSSDAELDPNSLFLSLNDISEAPFASYTRLNNLYVICSSPERFICKQENKIITQPIKGTAPRGENSILDETNKKNLRKDEKEINENVMIVDVSRNDLSRIAKKSTVQAIKLFEVETYKQVHQLVSTVTCTLKDDSTFESIIKATFPPASMTGAPKIRAMQLIDEYENFRRGAYSGSIGFIDDKGNFDFNVVIRSIIYNAQTNYFSFASGSAITSKCDPEKEYEECKLKAKAMEKVINTINFE
jgi:para-aminobenzoate synthetase component 1